MNACLMCNRVRLEQVLDLGKQPVSSHFTAAALQTSPSHPLSLAVCHACGVVQLAKPIPSVDLIPPYSWITYREPETHLDAVVRQILALDGMDSNAAIIGMSFKDVTTLDRFRKHGYAHVRSIDARADIGAAKADAGVESIQALFTPEKATLFSERNGYAKLVIARHILEHAEQPARFMAALASMLAPGGYLLIEVPDCRANLARRDYTMVWEEHVLYFTPETVRQNLGAVGCVPVSCEIYPFPFEDVIVLCARKAGAADATPQADIAVSSRNVALAKAYGRDFFGWTKKYHDLFTQMTATGKRLAAYGAGHLTAAFLNSHDVASYFACVADDTPQKQGLFMPGSGLPIVAPSRLAAGDIEHCLFGLAPQIEDKVIAKNGKFTALGGQFHSIFVDSPRSIRKLTAS